MKTTMQRTRTALALLCALLLLGGAAVALATGADTIVFTDAALEACVRAQIGKPSGDITKDDVKNVDQLNLSHETLEGLPEDQIVRDISNLADFPNLFSLSAINNRITDVSVLGTLPRLQYLDLGGNQVTDISGIGCANLREFALWDNQVEDISIIATMTHLERLDIQNNRIRDVSPLAGLKSLTFLRVFGCPIENLDVLQPIAGQLEEKDFEILNTPFDPAEVIAFDDALLEKRVREQLSIPEGDLTAGAVKYVRALDLSNAWGEDVPDGQRIHSVSALRYFVNLTELHLTRNAVADIQPLTELRSLQALNLSDNPVGDLSPLAGMTQLKYLYFNGEGRNVDFLKNMPELVSLSIGGGYEKLPAVLLSLPQLQELDAGGGSLTDISLLAQIPTLQRLRLGWNLITDLTPLRNLPLTALYLQGNPIADYTPIQALYINLQEKDFDAVFADDIAEEPLTISDKGFEKALRVALGIEDRPLTTRDAYLVKSLNIKTDRKNDGISFTDISALTWFVNLEELEFAPNTIRDLTPLAKLTKLQRLNLCFQEISDLSPLANLTELYSLQLRGNQITDISALAGLTKMTFLDVANNTITDFSAVQNMSKLQALYLDAAQGLDYASIAPILPRLRTLNDMELGDPELLQPLGMKDPNLEAALRSALGVPKEPITGLYALLITKLDLSRETEDASQPFTDITPLTAFANLQDLEIRNQAVTDLAPIGTLQRLSRLAVKGTPLSNLAPLTGMTCIRCLDIPGNQIVDLTPIASLTELNYLDVSGNKVEDYAPLANLQKLQNLHIGGNPGKDTSVLEKLIPNLRDMDFTPIATPDQVPDEPIAFTDPKLEAAVRESMGAGDGPISRLDAYYLTELHLNGRGITDITALQYFVNLTWLEMADNEITDLEPIKGLTRLTALFMPNNRVTSLEPLRGMSSLDFLSVANNLIADVSPLLDKAKLKQLFLAGNPITDWNVLASLATQLEQKDFDPSKSSTANSKPIVIKDKVLKKALQELMGITDRDITMADAAGVTLLDFTKIDAGKGKMKDISALQYFTELTELRLVGNAIRDLKPLAGLVQLTSLQLDQQKLQDIAPLSSLSKLTYLSLKGNAVKDISALANATSLVVLDLNNNKVKDLTPLGGLKTLEQLYLTQNSVADVTALGGLAQLRTLHLSGNKVKDVSPLAALANLESLQLGGNPVKDFSPLDTLSHTLRDKDF